MYQIAVVVIVVAVVYILMYNFGDQIKANDMYWAASGPALGIFLTFAFHALDNKAVTGNYQMTMAGLFGLTVYFVILAKTAESKKVKND